LKKEVKKKRKDEYHKRYPCKEAAENKKELGLEGEDEKEKKKKRKSRRKEKRRKKKKKKKNSSGRLRGVILAREMETQRRIRPNG